MRVKRLIASSVLPCCHAGRVSSESPERESQYAGPPDRRVASGGRNSFAIRTCRPLDLRQETNPYCLRRTSFSSCSQVIDAAKTFRHNVCIRNSLTRYLWTQA
jgi:hypothetical protein